MDDWDDDEDDEKSEEVDEGVITINVNFYAGDTYVGRKIFKDNESAAEGLAHMVTKSILMLDLNAEEFMKVLADKIVEK